MRQRKTKFPCPICRLHLERCICSHIQRIDLKTKVTLVIHAKELKRTTNTGRLALHALTNSTMVVRGLEMQNTDLSSLLSPGYESAMLYPCEEALDIDSFQRDTSKPLHLIVPDGNWRQAAKVNIRHPELKHLPRLKISKANLGKYHLRKEHFAEGLSTLESIALAIEAIEGPQAGLALQKLYQAKLRATLLGRGHSSDQLHSSSPL